jgi:small subunit ribosomal protein S14
MTFKAKYFFDIRKRVDILRLEKKRVLWKAIIQNQQMPLFLRFKFFLKLRQTRGASSVRLKNRCLVTNRSKSVLRFFKLSRIVFRNYARQGLLSGVRRSKLVSLVKSFSRDSVRDLLSRLKNGSCVRKGWVCVPYSAVNGLLLKKFYDKGLLSNYVYQAHLSMYVVFLKYDKNGFGFLNSLDHFSAPGRRVFLKFNDLKNLDRTFWFVLATEKGFFFSEDCLLFKRGGELICKVLR